MSFVIFASEMAGFSSAMVASGDRLVRAHVKARTLDALVPILLRVDVEGLDDFVFVACDEVTRRPRKSRRP